MVHLVDAALPLWVVVLLQPPLVGSRLDHQAPVVIINMLHGSPEQHRDTKYYANLFFHCSLKGLSRNIKCGLAAISDLVSSLPGSNYSVLGTERKIMKVLMKRMARRLCTDIWRLVDQHGVASSDIWPQEAFHVLQNFGIQYVLRKNRVPAKILDLVINSLVRKSCTILERYIFHLEYLPRVHFAVDYVHKSVSAFVNEVWRDEIWNSKKTIFLIKFSL